MSIERNQPCPCGSSKKYKKCCGISNVVSINQHVQEVEVRNLQHELMHYAHSKFADELQKLAAMALENILFDSTEEESKEYEIYSFYLRVWVIFCLETKKGQTILQSFIQHKSKTPLRSSTRSMLERWSTVRPSIYKLIRYDELNMAMVECIFNGAVESVYFQDSSEGLPEEGSLITGFLLPAGEYHQFFFDGLDIPSEYAEEFLDEIGDLEGGRIPLDDPSFVTRLFPDIIDVILFPAYDSMDDFIFEWNDPQHERVAEYLESGLAKEEVPSHVGKLAVGLWAIYCKKVSPNIRKPEVYAAAMEYLVLSTVSYFGYPSQSEVAQKYGVSVSSLSSRYRDIEDKLSYEISDLMQHMFEEQVKQFDDGDNEASFDQPTFSREAMERSFFDMEKLLEGKNFNSAEEINEYVNAHMNMDRPKKKPLSKKEEARELLYDAWDSNGKKRYELAR